MQKIISGKKLYTREHSANDAAMILEYGKTLEYCKLLLWGPYDENSAANYIESAMNMAKVQPRITYAMAVVQNSDNAFIGHTWVRHDSPDKATIAYFLNPKYHGLGYASELAGLLVDFCKDTLKVNVVEATAHEKNIASQKVLLKNGLNQISVLKAHRRAHGETADSYLYSKKLRG